MSRRASHCIRTQVIISINAILDHIDNRAILPRYGGSCTIYRPKGYPKKGRKKKEKRNNRPITRKQTNKTKHKNDTTSMLDQYVSECMVLIFNILNSITYVIMYTIVIQLVSCSPSSIDHIYVLIFLLY
jgi:hypothetical protein